MRWLLGISAGLAAVDQATKFLIERTLAPLESRVVIPGCFNLVNWRNTGAAWGMFQDSNLVLTIVGVLCILGLIAFRRSLLLTHRASALALGLILGGIVGNTIDRLRVGAVIDFLDFYVGVRHWPAFNVADSGICVGVALYLIVSWRSPTRPATTS